ncbi:MAG: DUF5777 family beta-barrel protein [Saprospiraceae bacterium]|nr:DUF5777 family beta-barrel protein [Saprospiraceae bacterium]
MKIVNNKVIKNIKALVKGLFPALLIVMLSVSWSMAQDEEGGLPDRPVLYTFNGAWLIDNQSVMVHTPGTFEFDILHRFGTMGNGYDDLYGLYASSNIRLGFSYVPIENLMVGFGLTKRKHLLDFNLKYALLKQTRSDAMPVSVTYFGNMAWDTRDEAMIGEVYNESDRLSFFHQVIVARKFTDWLSLQVAGSVSHYNLVSDQRENDHYAIAGGGSIKLTETLYAIFNVDQPITQHTAGNPNPNLSVGIEMATSSHEFQIFLGNYQNIIPQENNFFNSNNYNAEGESFWSNYLIGFNITRLWNW